MCKHRKDKIIEIDINTDGTLVFLNVTFQNKKKIICI